MDYAIEYALMSELYDASVSAAVEGKTLDYINTHHGIGKVGAVIKIIWTKITKILGNIITLIPRVLVKILSGGRAPTTGLANLSRSGLTGLMSLAAKRYNECASQIKKISRVAESAMQSRNTATMMKCKTQMQQYQHHMEDLKEWVVKYCGEACQRVAATWDIDDEGKTTKEMGEHVWQEIVPYGGFNISIEAIKTSAEALQKQAFRLANDTSVDENFSNEALAFTTAFQNVSNTFASSMRDAHDAFMDEWDKYLED